MSILSTMNSLLSDNLINKTGAAFGEPSSGIATALRTAGPALLAGIMKKGASPGGMSDLFAGVTGAGIDENVATKATSLLGNATGLAQFLSNGDSLLSGIFGDKVDGVTSALSQVAGVKPASALKVLAFAAPILGGVMKSLVAKRGLNAGGLASALAQEGDAIVNAGLDPRLTSAMGIDDLRQTVNSFSDAARRHVEAAASGTKGYARQAYLHPEPIKRRSSWWPWAVGAAAALIGVFLVTSLLNTRRAEQPAVAINVYFDGDQATIDNDDRRAIAAAAASAQASGGALTLTPVAATGEQNDQQLATQRAATIRDALISEGVANERIVLRSAQVARSAEPVNEAQRVEIALAADSGNRSRN